jgi:hypothetical protein
MKTYWNQFIEDYQSFIHKKNMSQILEAFWYYCEGRHREANEIITKENNF